MRHSDTKSVRKRVFLEPPSSEVDSFWATKVRKDNYWNDIELIISDCNRSINLSFGFTDKATRRKMVRKLDKLQQGLDIIREALNDEA